MQRQIFKIDFDIKANETASFTYKAGEVDNNGVEAELVNVDLVNASGVVDIRHLKDGFIERKPITITNGKANFQVPTAIEGEYEFEVEIVNDNGVTISATYLYIVLPSIGRSDISTDIEKVKGGNKNATSKIEN